MNDLIFALDIGTRSVTGIILKKSEDTFELIDYHMVEHKVRSMQDGQIHDVVKVAEVIIEVKAHLEKKHGPLLKVCVAAAGRALKTIEATASMELHQQPISNMETIKHLELSAVHTAQLELIAQENHVKSHDYYCVGYSVLQFKLDGDQIGSLLEQAGEEAKVEIIATFLPKVVVESLIAALSRANLEMEALTLEPIAAIDVLIPSSMRRLNVALVDIGAGTSDIALTDKGTIVAYGMVPVAGDEITEAVSDEYLLDFPKAEKTKRNIVDNGKDVVADILGFETTITYNELVSQISPSIEKLADAIAEEIYRLNNRSPKAVMLVGGGSLTPELTKVLATKLQLPANRVAVRGIDAIEQLEQTDLLPTGPDYVTPIGIAIAATQNPVHYVSVRVNGKTIRMFEMKQLTVGDACVQAGLEIRKYYGRPGMAAMIQLNGKEITLPGGYGNPPQLTLNGVPVTVDDRIHNGDILQVEKGADGTASIITVEELIGEMPTITVNFEEQEYTVDPQIYINRQKASKHAYIKDKDRIDLKQPKTIRDFLQFIKRDTLLADKQFEIIVNYKNLALEAGETTFFVNGKATSIEHPLKHRDLLEVTYAKEPTVHDLLKQLDKNYWTTISITFNDQPVTLKQKQLVVTRNGVELDEQETLHPNDEISITEKKNVSFIFQDVFRFVDIDLATITGNFKLYKNKNVSSFDDPIQTGDRLSIKS
ncbi:pilus assembly protein PilM [Virgibacillus sp. LDC-1]|uniref:cell division protein FtsA n=1 Tax=Virgibacillus sp. LDC-1 TaxID=3039856 RepID=UPI0024DE892E|nr:pilus assembly protein PilM [Virgibacillus sp. LDC-1]